MKQKLPLQQTVQHEKRRKEKKNGRRKIERERENRPFVKNKITFFEFRFRPHVLTTTKEILSAHLHVILPHQIFLRQIRWNESGGGVESTDVTLELCGSIAADVLQRTRFSLLHHCHLRIKVRDDSREIVAWILSTLNPALTKRGRWTGSRRVGILAVWKCLSGWHMMLSTWWWS